jgi:hypothetical protein
MFKSILVIVILRNDEAVQNTKKCIRQCHAELMTNDYTAIAVRK